MGFSLGIVGIWVSGWSFGVVGISSKVKTWELHELCCGFTRCSDSTNKVQYVEHDLMLHRAAGQNLPQNSAFTGQEQRNALRYNGLMRLDLPMDGD